jgi:hypothetical protein
LPYVWYGIDTKAAQPLRLGDSCVRYLKLSFGFKCPTHIHNSRWSNVFAFMNVILLSRNFVTSHSYSPECLRTDEHGIDTEQLVCEKETHCFRRATYEA